jgi:beta-glucosidase
LFAFGHGLTYTTFAYDKLKLAGGADLRATFTLKNTGKRAGVEVAQLYAAPPGRTHRLVGWVRVALESGEAREVTVSADPRLLASYEAGGWRRHAGEYSVYVGRAAGQRDLSGRVALSARTDLPAAQTAVSTEGGAVRGAIEEGLLVYKGVPYARAP